jgi:predicted nucleic acid-binding protein
VVWKLVKAKPIDLEEGVGVFDDAMGLVTERVAAAELWTQTVVLAVERDHPVYDTLFVALAASFVALAASRGSRVVTYDRRLRRRFPELTVAPSTLLRG